MNILRDNKKIVVVDVLGASGKNNALFDRSKVGLQARHAWWLCYIYEEAQRRGIQLLTTDLFLTLKQKPAKSILWKNSINPNPKLISELQSHGVRPAVLIGYEHPLYAPFFYWNIKAYSKVFDHTFMPSAARSLVSPRTTFHEFIAPHAYLPKDFTAESFGERKMLTMITSNTRTNRYKLWFSRVANVIRPLPTLQTRDIYVDRLRALAYFSQYDSFDLYGFRWDRKTAYTYGADAERYQKAAQKSWRGEVEDKLATMRNYKFSICFENCLYGGWITEKIFDPIVAGSVPIYFGAPDIHRHVPKEAFINFADFKNYKELATYLESMDQKTYNGYREAMRDYLKSQEFLALGQEKVGKEIVDLFESYF